MGATAARYHHATIYPALESQQNVLECVLTKLLEIDAPAASADLVKKVKNNIKILCWLCLDKLAGIAAPAASADLVKK